MSVDFYFACGKCNECIWVAQDGLSGFTFYSGEPDCMHSLGSFLRDHVLCSSILFLPEHQVEEMTRHEWRNSLGKEGSRS